MKTKITQSIDGYDIIIGIGQAHVDPVASAPIVAEALAKTDTCKAIDAYKQEISTLANAAMQARNSARSATKASDRNAYTREYQSRMEEIKEVEAKLLPLANELVALRKSLYESDLVVYMQPKPGETVITDAEAETITEAMIAATQAGELVDKDLKRVPDNRGRVYWVESSGTWTRQDVTRLGVAPKSGAIVDADLTDKQRQAIAAQIETERVKALSKQAKATEKESALAALVTQAAQKKAELEITGATDALKQAQAWYQEQAQAVEVKYG